MDDLISIIMPAYNAEKYIDSSIKSIINQTYTKWELIIVDDCSTDSTIRKLNEYRDERIRVYQNESNYGAAVSRNRALRLAKGRYIAFLDSDDIWMKNKLQNQLKFMKDNEYSFTYTDYCINLNGEWQPYIYYAPDHINRRRMYHYCYFSTITVMYDRTVIGDVQITDLRKNNDYAMWLHMIEKTDAYRYPYCLSVYMKHEGSISSGGKLKLIKWHYILFRQEFACSVAVSVIHTIENMIFGVHKKLKYKMFSTELQISEEVKK